MNGHRAFVIADSEDGKRLTMSGQSTPGAISSGVASSKMAKADPSHTETDRNPLKLTRPEFRVSRGVALPFGATRRADGGINFAVFSKHATAVSLVLFCPDGGQSTIEVPLDPRFNRTGQVWHVLVHGFDGPVHYGFKMQHPPTPAASSSLVTATFCWIRTPELFRSPRAAVRDPAGSGVR